MHLKEIVSFLQVLQYLIGKSAVIFFSPRAATKLLSLPPSSPTGNKVWGDPFYFLIFAFSGLPILAPINVPAVSLISIGEIKLIISRIFLPSSLYFFILSIISFIALLSLICSTVVNILDSSL